MQEPTRFNLLSTLQKNLKAAQKKIYLHRIIYAASYVSDPNFSNQEGRILNIAIESNIKLLNEEYADDLITGFCLIYHGYFINIVEGPELTLMKHVETLIETFDQTEENDDKKKKSKTPEVNKMKLLLMSFHINKRYFTAWNGRQATPPVLLDKIEPTTSVEVSSRHLQNCIMKLHRLMDYLRNIAPGFFRTTIDNISEFCQAFLPETQLLDFLLESPVVADLKEFAETFEAVPDYRIYHEAIWPVPSDFVPYHILGEHQSKKLITLETEEKEEKVGKEEKPEKEEEDLSGVEEGSEKDAKSDKEQNRGKSFSSS